MAKLKLNKSQEEAVLHIKGSTLIIAGAGSGKTRVITSRISHLLETKEGNSNSIVALTFTNKAAKEMLERIGEMTNGAHALPFIGTFHSYCLRLLKRYGYNIGLENFSIMDSSDQDKLLQNIVKKFALNKKTNSRQLAYHISNAKNLSAIGEKYHLFEYDQTMQEIFVAYEEEKKHSKCLDFDDLIIKGVELFNQENFLNQHHAQVKHILIDEYQDTSVIQHKLLKQMSLKDDKLVADSVCVVGDEDQSIYSWRGATVDNILQFPQEFPKVKIIKIEQNYRSADSILETANHLIKNNQNRNPKKLWSDKKAKNRVLILNTVSGYQEADIVANTVATQHKINPNKTVAALYRTHFQSRVIEEALLKKSVPYKIIGGIQFYERKEIKDLIAYLKVVINPYDKISFSRVYNCPPRKLGAQFAEQFFGLWQEEPFLNYQEAIEKLINLNVLTATKKESLINLAKILGSITHDLTPAAAIEKIAEDIKYFDYLKDNNSTEDAQSRIDNVRELIRAAKHSEIEGTTTISTFLDEIALMQDKLAAQDDSQPHIQLMTMHAAKGLEFDTVIVAGVEEGLLPSSRSMNSSEELEEERRLLYVGITRAREHLILTHAKSRNTYGQINDQTPSRFVHEVSSVVGQQVDCSYLNLFQSNELITQFLQNKKIDGNNPRKITPKSSATKLGMQSITTNRWRVNQPVKHPIFGVGLVKKIEPRKDSNILTIKFKIGFKKVDSKFVQKS